MASGEWLVMKQIMNAMSILIQCVRRRGILHVKTRRYRLRFFKSL